MLKEGLIAELRSSKEFFDRSTRCLEEAHAGYRPADDSMTAAQQIAHVAQTIEWFLDGVQNNGTFDMDFKNHMKPVLATKTIADARDWVDRAYAAAIAWVEKTPLEEMQKPFPADSIMGPAPSFSIVNGIVEHTAHHRGALTVYSRLQGLTPALPYMETQPA